MSPLLSSTRRLTSAKSVAAAAVLALLAGSLHAAAKQDEHAPAIRVVTVGHSPVDQLRDQLEPLLMMCRKQLKLPAEPNGMPSDAALASVASLETGTLYDGPRYAQYQITRNLLPDDKDGCRVKILRKFNVQLESSCDRRWSASAGGLGFEPKPMQSVEDVYRQDAALARAEPCQARLPMEADTAAALRKTSRQPAGLGVQCQWSNELGLHISEALGGAMPKHADPLSGSCYYAELPEYPYTTYQGSRRKVSVLFRMARIPGDTFRPPGIALGMVDQRLKEFSAGAPIPAGRFDRSAAEAFLKQPAIVPLAEPSK